MLANEAPILDAIPRAPLAAVAIAAMADSCIDWPPPGVPGGGAISDVTCGSAVAAVGTNGCADPPPFRLVYGGAAGGVGAALRGGILVGAAAGAEPGAAAAAAGGATGAGLVRSYRSVAGS
jgi:hypothetical protein